MRDLFYRLNHADIPVDISTFSKACKTRKGEHFCRIYAQLVAFVTSSHPYSGAYLVRLGRKRWAIEVTLETLFPSIVWFQLLKQIRRSTEIAAQYGFEVVLKSLPDPAYWERCKI